MIIFYNRNTNQLKYFTMTTKIEIVNDKYTKVSPFAFGTVFTNINEYTERETAEETFETIGVYKGKKVTDMTGVTYKIVDLTVTPDKTYTVKLRRIE